MEEHLRAALELLEPDETAQKFLSRTLTEKISTGVGILDRASPLRPTSVLEISGLAGSGKTELLYSIAATCVLPNDIEGVPVGGRGMHVLFFDLDCKFDIFRLATVMQARVQEALAAPAVAAGVNAEGAAELVEAAVRDAAARLHVITCPSSFHLLAALKTVKPAATALARRGGVAAVLIDNVTAHYYLDRSVRGEAAGGMGAGATGAALTLIKVHAAMAAGFRHLQHALRAPIIATKHTFGTIGGRGGGGDGGWMYKEVMMKPWSDFVTHRVVLRRGAGGGGRQSHLARWVKPDAGADDPFTISTGGVT